MRTAEKTHRDLHLFGPPDRRGIEEKERQIIAALPDVSSAGLYDVAHVFLTRSYRKLPVVDRDGRVIGQVSRRDILVAIESARDNPRR
ncbi:MAG: CBS domain-containing protein [Gemmatimonadetes bacterium]|jgi:CBS domain-containing protein|nr:CBS domain-containing protein [Gemmatimonadota bacterium]RUA01560.1 MAG: hypothetical protein DSY84_05180 [Candidatus Neomarinimicrobiota bacterium]